MKAISNALTNFLLDNTLMNRADLITLVLPNGQPLNVLFGTNYTSITYPVLPATVTVGGGTYPWYPADPTYPFVATGGGNPSSIALSQGQTVILQYASGVIDLHSNPAQWSVGPNGGTPAVGQAIIGANLGTAYPGIYIAPVAPPGSLIGGFANASGWLVSPPFFVGATAVLGPAPAGTTQLLLGASDNNYGDNNGSWTMTIVPTTYYSSLNGAWERGPFTNKADFKLSAESMKITGFVPESVIYPGTSTSLMQSVIFGALTGSRVLIQTLFWPLGSPPSSGFSMGTMQLQQGQIGNVKNTGRSIIECEVFDLTYMLNRPFPPHLIQSSCRHNFCDPGCTLLISNYTTTPIAVQSTSTNLYLDLVIPVWVTGTAYTYGNLIIYGNIVFMCSKNGTASGAFAPTIAQQVYGGTASDGTLTWTSMGSFAAGFSPMSASGQATQAFPIGYVIGATGQNTGFKMTVKVQTTSASTGYSELQLLKPLPFPVAAGDTFILVAGCDKTLSTCENIYNNLIHIGAMPFVPSPEIAQIIIWAIGLGLVELVKYLT